MVGSNAKRFGRRQRKARNLTKSPDPADLPKDVDVKRTEILFAERTDRPTATLAWPDASRIYITLIFYNDILPINSISGLNRPWFFSNISS